MPVNAICNTTDFAPQPRWADLMATLARRDQTALAALYDQTHREVFGLLLCLLPERQIAEEVLLDVYEEIWRQAGHFSAQSASPLGWLMQLARQHALERLRGLSQPQLAPDRFKALLDLAAQSATPPESRMLAAQRQQVRRALLRLTVDQRRALELSYFGGLNYIETAAQLGLPPAEVKTLLCRGMRALKTHLSLPQ